MIKMPDETTEQTEEQKLQAKYRNSVVAEVKRLNANYIGLEEMPIESLEALKNMELQKLNAKPEPEFKNLKQPIKEPDTKEVKNEAPEVARFNRLQIFHSQYTPVANMPKYKENCEIFTMMVNPDPRWPEWQVS